MFLDARYFLSLHTSIFATFFTNFLTARIRDCLPGAKDSSRDHLLVAIERADKFAVYYLST